MNKKLKKAFFMLGFALPIVAIPIVTVACGSTTHGSVTKDNNKESKQKLETNETNKKDASNIDDSQKVDSKNEEKSIDSKSEVAVDTQNSEIFLPTKSSKISDLIDKTSTSNFSFNSKNIEKERHFIENSKLNLIENQKVWINQEDENIFDNGEITAKWVNEPVFFEEESQYEDDFIDFEWIDSDVEDETFMENDSAWALVDEDETYEDWANETKQEVSNLNQETNISWENTNVESNSIKNQLEKKWEFNEEQEIFLEEDQDYSDDYIYDDWIDDIGTEEISQQDEFLTNNWVNYKE